MSQPHKGENLSGWLIIDKPAGISSAKAVSIIRRFFGGVKTGHAGTLDPLASGVLPIALGEATKTISYVMTTQKSYRFTLAWGAETQTDDCEGDITRRSDVLPSLSEIEAILPQFTGEIKQIPPDYSAVKIQGKRAYHLARKRDQQKTSKADADRQTPLTKLTARPVFIDHLRLIKSSPLEAEFEVLCGKGTYIRALARDMGRALGSAAHITRLERCSVGKFKLEDAISLDLFSEIGHVARASDHLMSVMTVLDDIPALAITQSEAQSLRYGQMLCLDHDRQSKLRHELASFKDIDRPQTALAVWDQSPVALINLDTDKVVPVRVFNL